MNYDSKEEAQKKADKINESQETIKYCPLLQDICKQNCVCFRKAFVQNTVSGQFEIRGFECMNYMFIG